MDCFQQFVMRIKEEVKVMKEGKELLIKELEEGFHKIKIEGIKCYIYKKEEEKDNTVIVSNKKIGSLN